MKKSAPLLSRLSWLIVAFTLLTAHLAYAQTASQLYAQGVQSYNQGNVEQAKHQLQLTLEIDKNFRPASALLNRIASEQQATSQAAPAAVTPAKSLARMIIPVEFKETTLQSALEFLRQRIESTSGGKVQVNFVLNVPTDLANKKVTLQMDHVPVTELLKYLGDLAGVRFEMQKYAILVLPAPAGGPSTEPAASTP